MSVLRLVGNVLWLVLVGWASALTFAVAGVVMYLLVVTIPFGIASFRLANYALWPFGRRVVGRADAGAPSTVGNVLWFLLAGVWVALVHFAAAVGFFLTIVGIPFAMASIRLGVLALAPLGKQVVTVDHRPVHAVPGRA